MEEFTQLRAASDYFSLSTDMRRVAATAPAESVHINNRELTTEFARLSFTPLHSIMETLNQIDRQT